MIAVANQSNEASSPADAPENGQNQNWLPFVVSYRAFLAIPGFEGRRLLDAVTCFPLTA
jgi:hypothetical protein